MPAGSHEPLVVLLIEMVLFSLGGAGTMLIFRTPSEQPPVQFCVLLSLLGSSGINFLALGVHIYMPGLDSAAFMAVRAAWHWAITVFVTAAVLTAAVALAKPIEQDNWRRILFQANVHDEVSTAAATSQAALVLALAALLLLLHTVFYTKLRSTVAEGLASRETGRVLVMLAAAAIYAQFVCQEALARVCALSAAAPCEVAAGTEQVAQDYSALVPSGIALGLLMVVDACTCIVREKMRAGRGTAVFVLYALLRALPGVAFGLAAVLVVEHTLRTFHIYHIVLGALLSLSYCWSVGSVWFALSTDMSTARTDPQDPEQDEPIIPAARSSEGEVKRIIRGTQQTTGTASQRHKKYM